MTTGSGYLAVNLNLLVVNYYSLIRNTATTPSHNSLRLYAGNLEILKCSPKEYFSRIKFLELKY